MKGVTKVTSGYAGGSSAGAPTYAQVSAGTTGHAEVIKVEYDPEVISFEKLLEVFFSSHDPTTMDRQGADVGEQYRSMILYMDDGQKAAAEKYIKELSDAKVYENPIVTELKPFDKFYPAEDYHQDYYEHNKNKPYCQLVINPKLDKLKKQHSDLFKK